ncbi:ThiF family adenylyltransferase [Naasia aerilata]|uniref:Adenylyltransferase/sulfurtransferase MoeZ n=1 Tax=Naasia aerilata TaxID=1162966 RepID=A0ABM8GDA3_9MICO|nr:ThiF family adenylyltransferase [Naasia aerilata]BDZ46245.1 adenylyltransferase/sulfurtransferase MoeZ [Naasia aerilata]
MTSVPDALRFVRQTTLPGFGAAGQQRLSEARVLVIGAGGLGSAVLPILAAAGVGGIGVVDDDLVEATNLHRQTLHTAADIGRLKVDSANDRLVPLATGTVTLHPVRLTEGNAPTLARAYDLILDGSDNFETRYLANDTARSLGIPLVWGAVSQYGGQVGVVLAAEGPDYRDLFPVPPDPDSILTCADGGVLPSVCGVVGALMATEALKLLSGLGEPLSGRVTSYDALTGRFREVGFGPDPDRVPASAAPTSEPVSSATPAGSAADEPDAISARELDALLDEGDPVQLVDVREPWEASIVALPGSRLLPLRSLDQTLGDLDPDVPVVAYCHHGVRSERALQVLRSAGLKVRHLEGGIDAWSRTVDPTLPRY